MVDLRVAALAQAHEVILGVGAALRYRDNMVNFLHRCDSTFFEALFAQRVRRHISGADPVPRTTILAGRVGRSLIPIVLLPRVLPVLIAVCSVSQVWTAGIGARSLWFLRHAITSFCGTDRAANIG